MPPRNGSSSGGKPVHQVKHLFTKTRYKSVAEKKLGWSVMKIAFVLIVAGFVFVGCWFMNWSGNGINVGSKTYPREGFCYYFNGLQVVQIKKQKFGNSSSDWDIECEFIRDVRTAKPKGSR